MDDKGFLFNYFMKMIEDKKLAQRLRDIARMRNYFSGESILEAGHKTNYVCMVVSGLVRGFYIDEEGNDRTKLMLMKEQPDLVARAKQEHIASYLGITPSSLSRIKRNI